MIKNLFKLQISDNDKLKAEPRLNEDKLKTEEVATSPVESRPKATFRTPISYTEETIHLEGSDKNIGGYVDKNEAINVRKLANKKYGYHENHGKGGRAA